MRGAAYRFISQLLLPPSVARAARLGDIMSTLLTQHPTPGQSQVLLPNSPSSYPLISVSHNFSLFQLVLDKFRDFFCLTFATYVDLGQHLQHLLHLLQHLHLYSPQHRNKCDIVSREVIKNANVYLTLMVDPLRSGLVIFCGQKGK